MTLCQSHPYSELDFKLHNLQEKSVRATHDIPLPRHRESRKCEWGCATTASNNEARSSDKRCLQQVSPVNVQFVIEKKSKINLHLLINCNEDDIDEHILIDVVNSVKLF